jgi:hypothetical protein
VEVLPGGTIVCGEDRGKRAIGGNSKERDVGQTVYYVGALGYIIRLRG